MVLITPCRKRYHPVIPVIMTEPFSMCRHTTNKKEKRGILTPWTWKMQDQEKHAHGKER